MQRQPKQTTMNETAELRRAHLDACVDIDEERMARDAKPARRGRKIKPAAAGMLGNVQQAIECLRSARELMKIAGCQKTVQRIRLALTSAGGAERHIHHRISRTKPDGAVRHWSE